MKTGGNQARAGRGEAINTVSGRSEPGNNGGRGKKTFFYGTSAFIIIMNKRGLWIRFEGSLFFIFFFISIQASHAHTHTQSHGNEIMKSVQSRAKED